MANGRDGPSGKETPKQERVNRHAGMTVKKSLCLLLPLLCWLLVSGCPASWGPFGLFRYLPVAKGNAWTFGCVAAAANAAADAYFEVRVEDASFANCRRNWLVSVSATSDESDWTAFPAGYFFLEDGVLYNTASIPTREALLKPIESGLVPFVHEDLTPRTITDADDPLHRFYQTDVRYVAGALEEFLPLRSLRFLDNIETAEYFITPADFGDDFRSVPECIALEAYRAVESEEPQWTPVLILGRGVGPLVVDIGPFLAGIGSTDLLHVTLGAATARRQR